MKTKPFFRKLLKSLKFRIIVLVLALGIIPCAVLVFAYPYMYEKRSVESDVSDLISQGQVLNNQIVSSGYLNRSGVNTMDSQLEAVSKSYSGRIMIINQSLTVVKDTYRVDEGKTVIWSYIVLALQGSTGSYYDADNQYLVVSVPVTATQDGEEVILGVLVISKAMTYIQTNQEYFQSVAIIYMLSLALLSVTVAFVFSNHAFHPFQKLKKSIEDVNNGITQEVAVEDYTEFAEASEQINGLLNQMRIVDESRQEFVSNVSHELKTPLTSMKVLADSLNGQENVPVELYREFMADIGDEIDRETKIINSLLSLVKMDKAAASLNIASVNMNELIELILKRLRPIAEKQQVEVVLESFRPVTAEVDEVKISLAITNLVENGIKYNEPGGWVHVSLNADHQYCYLKVEDSGMGIPQESLDHIFERFYRVDKSHSREIGGTGLGLAITRSAVVMHKGAIKVHSVEGQGTTFDVRIPLKYIAKEEP
jgi:signal transduction histidine kinase